MHRKVGLRINLNQLKNYASIGNTYYLIGNFVFAPGIFYNQI